MPKKSINIKPTKSGRSIAGNLAITKSLVKAATQRGFNLPKGK
jgi:hypothetical protein